MALSGFEQIRNVTADRGIVGANANRLIQQRNIEETKILGKQIEESRAVLNQEKKRRIQQNLINYNKARAEAEKIANKPTQNLAGFINPTVGPDGALRFENASIATDGLGAPTLNFLQKSDASGLVNQLKARGGTLGVPSYLSDEQLRQVQQQLPGFNIVRTGGTSAVEAGFKPGRVQSPGAIFPSGFKKLVADETSAEQAKEIRLQRLGFRRGELAFDSLDKDIRNEVYGEVVSYLTQHDPETIMALQLGDERFKGYVIEKFGRGLINV